MVHNFVRVHFTTRQVPAVALGVLEYGLSLNSLPDSFSPLNDDMESDKNW